MTAITHEDYQALAEFRYQIRRFLHFSEEQARSHGIEPQQHQLMLAIKGLPAGKQASIRQIADRLQLRHNSVVELIDRLEKQGTVVRSPGELDRREVRVSLTSSGEETLRKLSALHRQELENSGPALSKALRRVMQRAKSAARSAA